MNKVLGIKEIIILIVWVIFCIVGTVLIASEKAETKKNKRKWFEYLIECSFGIGIAFIGVVMSRNTIIVLGILAFIATKFIKVIPFVKQEYDDRKRKIPNRIFIGSLFFVMGTSLFMALGVVLIYAIIYVSF